MAGFKIIWKNIILPESSVSPSTLNGLKNDIGLDIPALVQPIGLDHKTTALPEAVSRRPLSRAGVLLHLVCEAAKEFLKPFLKEDPYSVGIYYAGPLPPVELELAKKIHASDRNAIEIARENADVKSEFKVEHWSQSTHLAIHLGIQGRTINFTHPTLGSKMALLQAERDLLSGQISAALVCGVNDFENLFSVALLAEKAPKGATLTESAAACIITKSDLTTKMGEPSDKNFHAGWFANNETLVALIRGA